MQTLPPLHAHDRLRVRFILHACAAFTCILIAQGPITLRAQLGSEMNLTNDTCRSTAPFFFQHSIVAAGTNIHVVYQDGPGPFGNVQYRRSRSGGLSWDIPKALTNVPSGIEYPSIALSGNTLHVVYQTHEFAVPPDTTGEIMYRRSTDGGETWESPIRLTQDTYESGIPDVAADNDEVLVVWTDIRTGYQVRYTRSTDGGLHWSADALLSPPSGEHGAASIAVSDSAFHLSWWKTSAIAGENECFHRRLVKRTGVWDQEQCVSAPEFLKPHNPTIAANGSHVYMVWTDALFGIDQLYLVHSSDWGVHWSNAVRVTHPPNNWPEMAGYYHQELGTIQCSHRTVDVIWKENRDRTGTQHVWEIYHNVSVDHGESWGTSDERWTTSLTNATFQYGLAVQDSETNPDSVDVHMIWTDHRNGDVQGEVYYAHRDYIVSAGMVPSPDRTLLHAFHPNPAHGASTLRFSLARVSRAHLSIVDMLGRIVTTRDLGEIQAGTHEFPVDLSMLPSGTYRYQIGLGTECASGVLTVVK